jgi:hypothetical protein
MKLRDDCKSLMLYHYQLLANDSQMIICQQNRHRIINFMSYFSSRGTTQILSQKDYQGAIADVDRDRAMVINLELQNFDRK